MTIPYSQYAAMTTEHRDTYLRSLTPEQLRAQLDANEHARKSVDSDADNGRSVAALLEPDVDTCDLAGGGT
jgi:hypothetical protein